MVFAEWRASLDDEEVCPPDLLENPNIKIFNLCIPGFINEVRYNDGKPYPSRTINQILAGLQRQLLDNDDCFPKFLDETKTLSFVLFMELVILFTIECTLVELVRRFVLLLLLVTMKNTNFGLVAFSAR